LKRELWWKPANIRIIGKKRKKKKPNSTSNSTGKEAVLEGLENEKMNGKQGVFGLFDPET